MITLITGLPGSGKTLYTLKTVVDYAKKENDALALLGKSPRQVYYHGIPELTIPDWHLMEKLDDWTTLPSGSIVVGDECQSTFRPRASSSPVPPHVSQLETHRHKGLDFFLLTQHPMFIDGNVRRLTGRHYHVVRFYGFPKSKIHEFQSVRENVDKNTKNSIENHFVYPKEVFTWYKSADLHTVKKRIPMRLVLIIVLPILGIAALWYGLQVVGGIGKEKPATGGLLSGNNPAAYNAALPLKKLSYAAARIPAVQSVAYSAPIYEKVIEPTTAPYPAACIFSKSKGCLCYSQQATIMDVDVKSCLQIVQHGVFLDWDTQNKAAMALNKGDGVKPHVDNRITSPTNVSMRSLPSDSAPL